MGVIINNQNTKILGFALKGRPSIPSASKKYETIEIEGRDGSLTRFINYEDLKFSLTFNILFQDDIKQKLREIKGLMSQAKSLSFDDSPNFFYKIKQAQVSDTESIIKRHGVFTVDFVADSFEYEASSVLESVSPNLNLEQHTQTLVDENNNFLWGSKGSATATMTYEAVTIPDNSKIVNGVRVTQTTSGQSGWRSPSYTVSPYTEVGTNTQVTRSVYIKNNATTDLGITLTIGYSENANGSSPKYSNTILTIPANSVFALYKDTFNLPSTAKYIWFYVYTQNPTISADFTFAGYKAEWGGVSTTWMPSATEEYIYTAKLLIRNNTTYFSQPIIKIFGQGNIKLYVNDELIEFKNVMDGIILDSEKQEAYLSDVNKNAQMIGNFPTFGIGENQIICTGKVNKVEILPQWRWLT